MEGRIEGRTDPILQDPSGYRQGSKKKNNIHATNEIW